jgi:uncharacterized Zn finger protein (UPF0148 family)
MDIIKTDCPACSNPLEFPKDFDNVICPNCGTAFRVREYKGAINLSRKNRPVEQSGSIGMDEAEALEVVEARLAELDEMISETSIEIEALKSREQSAPLQTGCSFFGLFMIVITVIAAFMPLGRKYFGNWLFYLALALVVLLGLRRISRKQASPIELERFRQERLELEEGLAQLESERARIYDLKTRLDLPEPDAENSDR